MKGPSPAGSIMRSTNESYLTELPRSPKISISQLHKRNYPLNFTLNWSNDKKEPEKTTNGQSPGFFSHTQQVYWSRGRVDKKKTYDCGLGSLGDFDVPVRDLHPPVSVDIPAISYNDFRERKYDSNPPVKKEEVYHPRTVYFSQRSKMVIYSKSPIYYLPDKGKNLTFGESIINMKYYKIRDTKKFELAQKPQNFKVKLKRLKEIIKDPLLYEN